MHWTEHDIIRNIHEVFPTRRDITPLGIGDDCALLSHLAPLVTTDASVESVHYDLGFMSLGDAAYRCLASNLSDIAAMGAYPAAWTLALGLRGDFSFDEIRNALEAFRMCIRDHAVPDAWLVGGDVVRSPASFFSITVWGDCRSDGETWAPVTRAGASDGDLIAVFGMPGRAAAGLDLLRNGNLTVDEREHYHPLLSAFLRPLALTALGPELARRHLVSAMMDTSDGIYSDLPKMAARSGLGFSVNPNNFIGDGLLNDAAQKCHCDAQDWQLYGGEDYGLLAAVKGTRVEQVRQLAYQYSIQLSLIGRFVAGESADWGGRCRDLSFHHFDGDSP